MPKPRTNKRAVAGSNAASMLYLLTQNTFCVYSKRKKEQKQIKTNEANGNLMGFRFPT